MLLSPEVIREVMRYFIAHPHAVDSLEGIARWRLRRMRVDDTVAETGIALEWLVARHAVQRINPSFGPPLYKIGETAIDVEPLLAANKETS